ncbi:TonB-dependent receptor plug domain-containing protein [Oligoflexus tunisiensis]|uniref:TonB-dependent receptor plug domain-containing protein n=1 Tax=Oligoflexus tunisiensis TaxID=708132 RepID=UPI000AB4E1B2|nr:TonB-dependent receptor [Oligoflexus tunisiensis]
MKTSIASAISFVLLAALVPAHAQEQATETKPTEANSPTTNRKKSEEKAEVIAVTGTRIKRVDMNVAAPLTIMSRDEIQATGKQTVTDIVKSLPASIGNSVTTTTTNGGTNGSGNIALRGLDPSSTLVLLNGRRLPLDAFGSSPDLNSIPVAAIDRIEILQEGASAIYGSDAIAGVINIITIKNWDGMDFGLYYGQSSRGDLETKSIDLTYGTTNDKGGILLGVNVYSQGSVKSRDRDVSKVALGPSSATPDASIRGVPNQPALIALPHAGIGGTPQTASDYRPFNADTDLYNFASITDAIMAQDRRSFFLSGDYELAKDLKGFVDTHYTNTFSKYNSAPTPLFTNRETGALTVAANNPYNPFGVELTDVRKRFLQLGPRASEADSNTFRGVVGVEGKILDQWTWDFAYNHGESKTRATIKNIVNKTNLALGIGDPANCTAVATLGCVPVNITGADGSLTPEMMDWLRIQATDYTKTETDAYTVNFAGDLAKTGLGTIGLAVGAEVRTEKYDSDTDPNSEQYNTIGSTNEKSTAGDRDVKEAYVELTVPFTELVEVNLAARHSDYNDFGSTTNPKAGLKISPLNGLTLRGSYSTGFRAPSLVELYQGQQENFASLRDPCQTPGACTVQSDPTIIQFLALEGGNPDLDPEKSKSFTYGLTYSIADFNAKIDYFSIKTENAINTSAQFVVDQFRANGLYADKVLLDANNNILTIEAIALNLASRKVEGVDLAFDYALRNTAAGSFTFNLMGGHYIKYMNQADKSAPFENIVGKFVDSASDGRGSIPKWKGLLDIGWANRGIDAGVTVNTVSKLDAPQGTTEEYQTLEQWTTYDLRAGYDFMNYGKFTVGINNVLDEKPPVTDAGFNDNIDARAHNLIGRFYYARWGVTL